MMLDEGMRLLFHLPWAFVASKPSAKMDTKEKKLKTNDDGNIFQRGSKRQIGNVSAHSFWRINHSLCNLLVTKTSFKKKGGDYLKTVTGIGVKFKILGGEFKQQLARQLGNYLSIDQWTCKVDDKRQKSHTSLRLFNVWFSLSAFPKLCCQPDHDALPAWVPNLMSKVSKVGIFRALTIKSIASSGETHSTCLWVSRIATLPQNNKKRNTDIQNSQTSVFGQSLP